MKYSNEPNLSKFIIPASLLLGASSLTSRILGIIRDHFLTYEFGATRVVAEKVSELDAYYAAFRIPDFIYNLLILGTISAIFIPVFTSLIHRNKDEAWKLASTMINLIIFIMLGVGFAAFVFAPYIMHYFTFGFNEETRGLTVSLARIMLLSPIFFGISAVFGSVLNSSRKFLAIALAPIFYNIGILFGIFVLIPYLGIYGVAVGVILGALLHMLVQMIGLRGAGFHYTPQMDLKNTIVQDLYRLAVPKIIANSAWQMNLVVDTVIGSSLVAGSIAIINLATNLQSLPVGIIGVSVAISTFATFSEIAANNETAKFAEKLMQTMSTILFLIIPATVGMILLRTEIVRLILGSGEFNWTDTVLTANTLGFMCIGLFAVALTPLLTRAFYAYQDTKTPLLVSLVTVSVNIVLSILLTKVLNMGVIGLGLSFSLANIVSFTLLFLTLKLKLREHLSQLNIIISAMKILFCAIVMAGVVQITKTLVGNSVDMTRFAGVLIKTISSVTTGMLSYFIIAKIMRCKELVYIFKKRK